MIGRFYHFWIMLVFLVACKMPASQAPRLPPSTSIVQPSSPVQDPLATNTASPSQDNVETPLPSLTPSLSPLLGWCTPSKNPSPAIQGKLRVAYTSSRDAWLWEEGAQPLRLTQSGNVENPLLSGDAQLLAFTRRPGKGQSEIWVMDLNNHQERLLLSAKQLSDLPTTGSSQKQGLIAVIPANLHWVPGSHRLAFNTYPVLKNPDLWIYVPDDLWLLDTEHGNIHPLIAQGAGGHAVFSPDGNWAAILRLQGIAMLDVRNGTLHKDLLKGYAAVAEGESYYYPWPAWTPDSSAILLGLPVSPNLYTTQARVSLWRIRSAGGHVESLGNLPAFAPSLSFSPDRLSVAFWRISPGGSLRELWIARLAGLEQIQAAGGELIEFWGWASDGERFIYTKPTPPSIVQAGFCLPASVLPGFPALPLSLRWVDQERFLSLLPTQGHYELRLTGPSGNQTIAQVWSEEPAYDFAYTR